MSDKRYEVAIIGAGPAGMTAGIYAARAGKSVIIIEKKSPGGQIINTLDVDNYPAMPGISGVKYSMALKEQAESFGSEFKFDEVSGIDRVESDKPYFVIHGKAEDYEAVAVILATGLENRKIGLPGEDKLISHGISFCAACDGAFFRGKDVAVYGGGNTALEDATYLASICNTVTIIHRRDRFRGEQALVDQLKQYKNVKYIMESTITEVKGDNMIEGIVVKNKNSEETKEIKVDGLFLAIGQIPNGKIFSNITDVDERGYYDVDENCVSGAFPGVFVAGDGRSKKIRQLTTAVSDGSVAGSAASSYIDRLNGREYI